MDVASNRYGSVAKRAYELFESRGRVDGHDLDDWLQAEREVGTPGTSTVQVTAAIWTRDRLAAFDVPLPAGNRLDRAKTKLEEVDAGRLVLTAENDELLETVNEAQWTIIEQYIIARSLGKPGGRLSRERLRKLEEMQSGADGPAERNPPARNTQFELYAAAFFTIGDVAIGLAEPDLVFDLFGSPCGLAAKRVQSFRQAPQCAREAADQIAAAGLIGVVALNVDVLVTLSPGGPGPETTLDERLEVIREVERLMAERDEVIATMSFGRDCIWNFSGSRPVAELSHAVRFTVHPRSVGDDAAQAFFDRLMARIDERLQTL